MHVTVSNIATQTVYAYAIQVLSKIIIQIIIYHQYGDSAWTFDHPEYSDHR